MQEQLLELSDVWPHPYNMRTIILEEVRWHANRLWALGGATPVAATSTTIIPWCIRVWACRLHARDGAI